MNKQSIIVAIIALVVGFGGGYWTGSSISKPAAVTASSGFTRGSGANFTRGAAGGANGGMLSGTVAKQDSSSITVNTRDGSSHVVLVTPATTIMKSVTGSLSDINTGANVTVLGTTNSYGSLSANEIQLRPATSAVAPTTGQ